MSSEDSLAGMNVSAFITPDTTFLLHASADDPTQYSLHFGMYSPGPHVTLYSARDDLLRLRDALTAALEQPPLVEDSAS